MRWKLIKHEEHQEIITSKFLWFPKLIGDEYRWLERTAWLQHELWSAYSGWYWVDDRWIS